MIQPEESLGCDWGVKKTPVLTHQKCHLAGLVFPLGGVRILREYLFGGIQVVAKIMFLKILAPSKSPKKNAEGYLLNFVKDTISINSV